MVKDIISRAKGWNERKSPGKSRPKDELLVKASGFPYLLKLSQRERSLQPKAMIMYKRPQTRELPMTSMQPLMIVLLGPAEITPYVATMVNITAWLKRKINSALQQKESSRPSVCLVRTVGSSSPLVCFVKNPNCIGNRHNKVALKTTCIKKVKFNIIRIRTGCQYIGYFSTEKT